MRKNKAHCQSVRFYARCQLLEQSTVVKSPDVAAEEPKNNKNLQPESNVIYSVGL